MSDPSELIEVGEEFLIHHGLTIEHREYDPSQAHRYYMRTRKLKGRKKVVPLKKRDRVSEFSPTLRTIMNQGKAITNAGRSFINRLFG